MFTFSMRNDKRIVNHQEKQWNHGVDIEDTSINYQHSLILIVSDVHTVRLTLSYITFAIKFENKK